MRCLYCDKRLSLLKLAKGDDFCSPEHFDAHQLKLSKDAIQRLMGAPDEQGPRQPLHFTSNDDAQGSARGNVMPETRAQEEDLQPTASLDPSPPYAPFAIAYPQHFAPQQPASQSPALIAGELDPDRPAASTLSIPVHQWEESDGLVNLCVRLSLATTTPLNWTSPRDLLLAEEGFAGEVVRPSLKASPDLSEVESLAAEEPAQITDIAPPADIAPPLDLVPPAAAVPQVEVAPPITATPVDAAPIKPVVLAMHVAPASSVEPVQSSLPVVSIVPEEPAERVLPFLIAPSFRERTVPPMTLDAAASSKPNPAALFPVLDLGSRIADSPGAIARSTRFAPAASLHARDSRPHWLESTSELPIAGRIVLPAGERKTRRDGWHASSDVMGLTSTVLETEREATRAAEFIPPVPLSLVARPAAGRVELLDPAQALAGQPAVCRTLVAFSGDFVPTSEPPRPEAFGRTPPIALAAQAPQMRSVNPAPIYMAAVETHPLGQEAVFADLTVSALDSGLRSILAKSAPAEPVSTGGWRNHTPHYPLPVSIAKGPESPAFPIQLLSFEVGCVRQKPASVETPSLAGRPHRPVVRKEVDCVAPQGEGPSPSAALPKLRVSDAQGVSTKVELVRSSIMAVTFERPFAAASTAVFPAPDLCYGTLTSFPQAIQIPHQGAVSLGVPYLSWGACIPVRQTPPALKFLPLRGGPVLPSAGTWVRLTSLHRSGR
jgi:hypothetical protein